MYKYIQAIVHEFNSFDIYVNNANHPERGNLNSETRFGPSSGQD